MKKAFIFFFLGAVFLPLCFSQNMLMLSGEYSFFKPQFWGAGIGFNMKYFNEYIQNDLTLNFGSIWAKDVPVEEEESDEDRPPVVQVESLGSSMRFVFYLRDNLYFALEGDWVGLRAGVFASLGVYNIIELPMSYDMLFNGGGFAGITILPKSLISVALDLCPGYLVAFRLKDGISKNQEGFSLSLALSIRFNFDKL